MKRRSDILSFTAVKFRVEVFWVVTRVGYQRFGGPCCLHLQGGVTGHSQHNCNTTRRHNSQDLDLKK